MTLFLLGVALAGIAGSLAWMTVLLKRVCCDLWANTWDEISKSF